MARLRPRVTRADALALGWAAFAGSLALGFGPSLVTVGLPTVAWLGLMADGVARPASSVLVPTLTHGPRRGDSVALTFDDGPDPAVTPVILDALAAHKARATFFAIGRHLEAHPALARRIAAEHELGNHSYAHSRRLNFRGVATMTREIARGEAAVAAVGGPPRPLYRPPIGLKNPPLARIAARRGLTVVTWSLHGRDTGRVSAAQIAQRVIERVRPGDIVLLHDGCDRPGADRRPTAEAVSEILVGLKKIGLGSVTVSDLVRR